MSPVTAPNRAPENRDSHRDALVEGAPQPIHDWLGRFHGATLRAYRSGLAEWLLWCTGGAVDPIEASSADVGRYAAWLATAPSERTGRPRMPRTQMRLLATISSLYDHLEAEEIIGRSPCTRMIRPKPGDPTTPALTLEEVARVETAAAEMGARTEAAVSVLLRTGVRADSLLGLEVGHLRTEGGRLVAKFRAKGNKWLDLPVGERCALALERLRGERVSGYLFEGRVEGTAMSYDALLADIKRVGQLAGVDRCTPHVFRATWATTALDAGVSPAYVQAVLGHARTDTTMGYDRRRLALVRRATAMDAVESAYDKGLAA